MHKVLQSPPPAVRFLGNGRRRPRAGAELSPEQTHSLIEQVFSWLYRPSSAFLPCVLLGFILWLSPPEFGGGFVERESVTFVNVLFLIAWYGNIFLFARIGERMAFSSPLLRMFRFDEVTFYFVVTVFSAIGTFACWYTVVKSGVSVLDLIVNSDVNQAKVALYDEYSFIHTLRYSVALSGGLALFRMLFRGRRGLIDIFNIVLLVIVAGIAARLFILLAAYICFGMALHFGGLERFRIRRLLIAFVCLFGTLTLLTWTREANTYSRWGYDNPLLMQYLQVKRYLGSPVQVSLGVARIAWDRPDLAPNKLKVWKNVLPTFLLPEDEKPDNSGGVGYQWYLGQIDVDVGLTTNSALADLYDNFGVYCFPFMSFTALLFAWLAGTFWKSKGPLFLIALVIQYEFFELWRCFSFNQGHCIFLVAEALFAGLISVLIPWCRHESHGFLAPRR